MTERRHAEPISKIADLLGERLSTSAALREQHGHTTTWIANQPPDAVAFPASTEEVAAIMRIAHDHTMPVIGFGTGTSLEGHVNAPQGGLCVDFSRMDRVLAVHADDMDAVVQPGVTRKGLNAHLRDTGLFFPIDPGADASLGGMAATRASGTNAVRYGTMRENVLSLEVVLADGRVIRTGGRARKSAAGYDLTRLFVGSEGTLGLITELTLRLHGIPEAMSAAHSSFASVEAACRAVIDTIRYGVPVARIELLDAMCVEAINAHSGLSLPVSPLLLLEFHGSKAGVAEQAALFGEIAAEHGATGFHWATEAGERDRIWQARHDAYWAMRALRPQAAAIATDVCVPISRLSDIVSAAVEKAAALDLLAPNLGHVGDGNFHSTVLIDADDPAERRAAEAYIAYLSETALAMGGTCSGEHGIGQGKRASLVKELGAAAPLIGDIKAALDPAGILNPGKIWGP